MKVTCCIWSLIGQFLSVNCSSNVCHHLMASTGEMPVISRLKIILFVTERANKLRMSRHNRVHNAMLHKEIKLQDHVIQKSSRELCVSLL